MLKKFPNSINIHHAAVPTDVTSLKVVPKSGSSEAVSSVVQFNVVGRGHKDVNLVGRGHKRC